MRPSEGLGKGQGSRSRGGSAVGPKQPPFVHELIAIKGPVFTPGARPRAGVRLEDPRARTTVTDVPGPKDRRCRPVALVTKVTHAGETGPGVATHASRIKMRGFGGVTSIEGARKG